MDRCPVRCCHYSFMGSLLMFVKIIVQLQYSIGAAFATVINISQSIHVYLGPFSAVRFTLCH